MKSNCLFKVISRNSKIFDIEMKGKKLTVSKDRLKLAFLEPIEINVQDKTVKRKIFKLAESLKHLPDVELFADSGNSKNSYSRSLKQSDWPEITNFVFFVFIINF